MPSPRIIIAAICAVLGAAFGGYRYGCGVQGTEDALAAETLRRENAEAFALVARETRADEQRRQELANAAITKRARDVERINAGLVADLDRLRNRPERPTGQVSATSQAAGDPRPCCTGAELCGSDAQFLVGEAARSDRQRAALIECYAIHDTAGPAASGRDAQLPQ